jgi:glucosamine--fructose-6-phosphate aminotransferase (isomerizing)
MLNAEYKTINPQTTGLQQPKQGVTAMTQMWNEIYEQPIALERCHEKNRQVLAEIVGAIRAKKIDQVVIAARGTSDHAGVYGKYVLEMLTGMPVSLAASSVFTVYKRSMKLQNALVIGISQSGEAADVLEVLRGANESGALTVGVTNFPESPVAAESKFHLNCEAGVELSVAATKTFTTQLFLLARLAALWAEDRDLEGELETIPERISHTFETARDIEDSVARYRFMHECFVLARGVNYAVSLEAALKIQETTYVRAKAFATSDFQHGPIAMLERDIPVIVYAPEGPSFADMKEMMRRLCEGNIEMVVVSNNEEALKMGACGFPIPATDNDIVSPFFNVVVAQMFACKLALVKGMNPDSPRGLHKVTITK